MNRRKFFKAAGLSALAMAAGMNPLPSEGMELSYVAPQTNRLMNNHKKMKHKCKITVLKRECYQDLQEKYLADPKSGPCPFFREGQEIIVDSENYFRMLHGTFCAEAWVSTQFRAPSFERALSSALNRVVLKNRFKNYMSL